jgi:signal transduction histidine kinase
MPIIQRHGGSICVESAPNEGATFTILLPRMAVEIVGISAPQGFGGLGA